MGSYGAYGDAYPGRARSVAPVPCTLVPGGDPATVNPVGRWCGIEGSIVDMLAKGARPDQIVPALWIGECVPNGTMTHSGWTQPKVRDFLDFVGGVGVSTIAIWDLVVSAGGLPTCTWFVPELRRWARPPALLGGDRGVL